MQLIPKSDDPTITTHKNIYQLPLKPNSSINPHHHHHTSNDNNDRNHNDYKFRGTIKNVKIKFVSLYQCKLMKKILSFFVYIF